MQERFQMDLGGRTLSLETGALARQANAAVLVRYGDTVVLVTATMSKEPREGVDFFPLLVDYEERMYAIGRIPRVWLRREGRPTEAAILAARMIDRPIRPLFPDGFRNDVHVVATVMSVDHDHAPEIAALIGASAALTISNIPFQGPIAGVRVGRVEGRLVVNPTREQAVKSEMDLVVAGTKDGVMMVEAGANELPEELMLEGIMFGHEEIKRIIALQEQMRSQLGEAKVEVALRTLSEELESFVRQTALGDLKQILRHGDKKAREDAVSELKKRLLEDYRGRFGDEAYATAARSLEYAYDKLVKEEVRKMIVEEGNRPDGRALDEIRPISCAVGLLPRTHGSGLFTRGQTQILSVCTLGLKSDEQLLDDLRDEDRKRYIHHYNFPAFSVGEVRPMRGPGRREIGHGALAERALLPVIPPEDKFPYTIRVVSEVLESNGSTSQGSVCGSTLALMDAGVPISKAVAGVAMGLVKHGDGFAILSDIQGIEDALGDMDFKVAGTRDGVTALQMDIKIQGVSREILEQALRQAKAGRLFVLERMLEVIDRPRPDLSPYAPRITTLTIPVEKIRDVIGPGGKMINKIIEQTGVEIDIEDDGRVFIASTDEEAGKRAVQLIEAIVKDVEVGAVYLGKVKRIMNFGAFVEILPGKEGLVHISQLAPGRIGRVEDVVNIGDEVLVKVTEIDKLGRINLSRKDALPEAGAGENGQHDGRAAQQPAAQGARERERDGNRPRRRRR